MTSFPSKNIHETYVPHRLEDVVAKIIATRDEWQHLEAGVPISIGGRLRTHREEAGLQLEAADQLLALAKEFDDCAAEIFLPRGCLERADGIPSVLLNSIGDVFSPDLQEILSITQKNLTNRQGQREIIAAAEKAPEYEQALRDQLNKTSTGRTCLQIADSKRISFKFYQASQDATRRQLPIGLYSSLNKSIYLIHEGGFLSHHHASTTVHELVHCGQNKTPLMHWIGTPVDQFIGTKLLEAGAYAGEAAHEFEDTNQAPEIFPPMDVLSRIARYGCTHDEETDLLDIYPSFVFAHCLGFLGTLRSDRLMSTYERGHISIDLYRSITDGMFSTAVEQSPLLSLNHLSQFCRTPTGESWFDLAPSLMRSAIVEAVRTPHHPFLQRVMQKYAVTPA